MTPVVHGLSLQGPGVQMILLYFLEVETTVATHDLGCVVTTKNSVRIDVLVQ